MTAPGSSAPIPQPAPVASCGNALRRIAWLAWVVQIRLRFVLVVAAVLALVTQWNVLRNLWDTATRSRAASAKPVSGTTEYFCPMDPGVISQWPEKCSICNMPLVQRARGEAVALPDGIVARMQFSPYRVQLAGIRTSTAEFRPLARTISLGGVVRVRQAAPPAAIAEFRAFERDLVFLPAGRTLAIECDGQRPLDPFSGAITKVETSEAGPRIEVTIADPARRLHPGLFVRATVHFAMDELEPFRSAPSGAPPLAANARRQVYVCTDHADVVQLQAGNCPFDRSQLVVRSLAASQRVGWWCPMHPHVASSEPGKQCTACSGMQLVPRIVTYRPPGTVLAIPKSAVIETGGRRVVFVERGPGMFDARLINTGPSADGFTTVVDGLAPDERVVTAGAFLLDAETRLNPSLATAYFGAAAAGTVQRPREPIVGTNDDSHLIARQKTCPVSGKPLGSMGEAVRMSLRGRTVFLCCEGCRDSALADPALTLSRLP